MCHYPKGLIWLLLLKAGHVWSQHLRWSESCSKDLRHLYLSWWLSSASCFLFWILKTLLLSISQSSFALFVFLLVIQQAGFKLPASCDRAWVGERTTFLFRWGFTTILSLLLIHALVFQALICWFSRQCLPPRHQKCCSHHQQSPPRSSHQRCSVKKSVLKNFAKFTGKHLRQSFFFNKVAGAACNFIKKETLTQVFPVNFTKFLRIPFLQKTSGRLLLSS